MRLVLRAAVLMICRCVTAPAVALMAQPPSEIAPPVPVLPAPPTAETEWLIGLSPDEVIHYFGTPARDAAQDNVRLLDYSNSVCNLAIFMQRQAAGAQYAVTSVLTLDQKQRPIRPGPCMASFAKVRSPR